VLVFTSFSNVINLAALRTLHSKRQRIRGVT